jgi:hypothetical protein
MRPGAAAIGTPVAWATADGWSRPDRNSLISRVLGIIASTTGQVAPVIPEAALVPRPWIDARPQQI